ncbi:MAG: hypothetical protein ABJM02_04620 [Paracoccaceae bacterium]
MEIDYSGYPSMNGWDQRQDLRRAVGTRYNLLLIPEFLKDPSHDVVLLDAFAYLLRSSLRVVFSDDERITLRRVSRERKMKYSNSSIDYFTEMANSHDWRTGIPSPFRDEVELEAMIWDVEYKTHIFEQNARYDMMDDWDRKYAQLKQYFLDNAPTWGFWSRWYDGMLTGRPLNWELQRDVVLQIADEDWEKGAGHIAGLIEQIERASIRGPSQKEVETQVQKVLQNALVHETSARGLERLVQMAIDAYRREISNALPDELEPLEHLPFIFDAIAVILAGQAPATQKEAKLCHLVTEMAATIDTLNRRLSGWKSRQTGNSGRQLFADAFYARAGERSADAMTQAVAQCFQDVILPEVGRDFPQIGKD